MHASVHVFLTKLQDWGMRTKYMDVDKLKLMLPGI